MMMKYRRFTRRMFAALVMVLLLLGTFTAGRISADLSPSAYASETPAEFTIFWEAWDVVVENFVDRSQIDFQKMTYGAIEGMLSSLGDEGHTTFLSPEAVEQHRSELSGSFEGIGAYVAMEDERVIIVAPIEGSPAESAGLLPGDVILGVDGESIDGLDLNEVINRIKGPADTTVELRVLHPESREIEILSIVRGRIEIASVQWAEIPGTQLAYIQISQFASRTSDDLITALQEIEATSVNGEPVTGIVLDLRNNPGGFLREAIRVSTQFLPAGSTILLERDAEQAIRTFRSRGSGLAREIPIVVLVNEGTASAGEITAGAIKENGRGELIGETTFGTGTVLNQFNLSDGSALLLGVTNWLTPEGNLIKGQGVSPNVQIEMAASVPQIDARTLRTITVVELAESQDLQFKEALKQLGFPIRSTARVQPRGLPIR